RPPTPSDDRPELRRDRPADPGRVGPGSACARAQWQPGEHALSAGLLAERGESADSSTDSEVIARLIATAPGRTWVERIRYTMPFIKGAYSLTMMTPTELIAVRDPYGIRPLCFGRLGKSWVIASESCALDTIGAALLRD